MLSKARSEPIKQEHQVGSLNSCINELQQQASAQGLELEDAHHRYIECRREQTGLQEELSMKEKVLRDTQIRNTHEMGEMKRAEELRVDEFSLHKLSESHDAIQRLTMNSMSDSGKLKNWNRITSGDCLKFPVNQQRFQVLISMLSRDKRLPLDAWNLSGPQENVFGNQFSTSDSSRNHYQGIHHSTTPGVPGSVPVHIGVHIGTGTPVAREEKRIGSTSPMPMFARRPSTMSSSIPVDTPQNPMVGQQ